MIFLALFDYFLGRLCVVGGWGGVRGVRGGVCACCAGLVLSERVFFSAAALIWGSRRIH
jgi:hypothetical protein